jgi:phosphocarrier protein FPr
MIELEPRQIRLQANPASKSEAIQQVGQLLVDSGHIKPGYVDSMLGREKVANTYLGNGITIPHGLPKDRELINQTGIAVMQVPGGVTWNEGETARLIVGIAAKSDEHIEILRRLTRVLGNKEQVAQLVQTDDPMDIIEALTGERPSPPPPAADLTDFAQQFDIVIPNATGLHARPAANFVDLAKQFDADIKVRYGERVADGKSLITLLQLGAEKGANIRVSAQGAQADAALAALQAAIAEGLGDEEEEATPVISGTHDWEPTSVGATISGISAANGLAISVIRQFEQHDIVVEDEPGRPAEEGEKFQQALSTAQAELETLYE